MKSRGISQLPVLRDGKVVGVLTEQDLLQSFGASEAPLNSKVGVIMDRSVPTVESSTPLSVLQSIVMAKGKAIVIDQEGCPIHIMTKIDLVEWFSKRYQSGDL